MSRAAALDALRRLESLRQQPDAEAERRPLLATLARATLASPGAVRRLHEALCWLRAYPGSDAERERVATLLDGFDRRADLRRHRRALADSGIAGTELHYRFFAGQAIWLAQRWPQHLQLDRTDREAEVRIAAALPALVTPAEGQALQELKPSGYAALDLLRGRLNDAAFLLDRIAAMPGDSRTREVFSDTLDASYVLRPGAGTPSRSTARFTAAPLARGACTPVRGRPDLREQLRQPPRAWRRLSVAEGSALIDLARGAMVTRARSLEAFSYADARDAWLADDGDGLAFALAGMTPERRYAVPALYGGLTLRNGVPIGYLQADIVGRTAAISFNTFDTFRGGEAAHTFARLLAVLHHAFGTTSFSIEPYQLGQGNDEGLASGAWWFYFKLGFRPRAAAVRRLAREEIARQARRPSHRSSAATLRQLAATHLFFDLDPRRPHPLPPLAALGLAAAVDLSLRSGADREAAVDAASLELLRRCGLEGWRGFTADERTAWRRLAPIVMRFDLEAWSEAERRDLVALLRAKGARSEREHVQRVLAHPRFEQALLAAGRRA